MGKFSIYRNVDVCMEANVRITLDEVIEELNEEEAKELLKKLIESFPKIFKGLKPDTDTTNKLFPTLIKEDLIEKYKKENQPLQNFLKK